MLPDDKDGEDYQDDDEDRRDVAPDPIDAGTDTAHVFAAMGACWRAVAYFAVAFRTVD